MEITARHIAKNVMILVDITYVIRQLAQRSVVQNIMEITVLLSARNVIIMFMIHVRRKKVVRNGSNDFYFRK